MGDVLQSSYGLRQHATVVGHPARFSSLFTWGPEEVFLPLQRLRSSHRSTFLDCLLCVLIFFWSLSLLFSQCMACRPFDRLFLLFVLRVPHGQLFQTYLRLIVHLFRLALIIPASILKKYMEEFERFYCVKDLRYLHCSTLERFASGPRWPRCRPDRSIAPELNRQLPSAVTISIFFFWSLKKGGSSAPSEPPLATCL